MNLHKKQNFFNYIFFNIKNKIYYIYCYTFYYSKYTYDNYSFQISICNIFFCNLKNQNSKILII